MVLLVTSASGVNGSGYGKLLAFDADGKLLGPFSEDARIVDPRGVGVDGSLLFLNSGSDRILALDGRGRVVRETGVIPAALAGLLLGMNAPDAQLIASVTFAAILVTILIQAPTTRWLAGRLRLLAKDGE